MSSWGLIEEQVLQQEEMARVSTSYLTRFLAFLDELGLERSSCDFFLLIEDNWSMVARLDRGKCTRSDLNRSAYERHSSSGIRF